MKRFSKIIFVLTGCILVSALVGYSVSTCLKEFNFNDPNPLAKWSRMVLNGQVDYTIVKYGEDSYVNAFSDKTCSALYYRIGFKLKDYPVLSWKWRAVKFPDKSNAVTEKEKDDYVARIYLIFPFLSFSSSKFIEYVWDENIPAGTVLDSPEGNNIKIIVARSGYAKEGEWASESRNAYDDYVKAFGGSPRLKVGAVAIMCDADSTRTKAEALFDDIVISK